MSSATNCRKIITRTSKGMAKGILCRTPRRGAREATRRLDKGRSPSGCRFRSSSLSEDKSGGIRMNAWAFTHTAASTNGPMSSSAVTIQ